MVLFINQLISSVLEIIVFALIPFIWWLATSKDKEKFFHWIGLKKCRREDVKPVVQFATIVEICFIILSVYMLYTLRNLENMATSEFTGLGWKALPAIIVYAMFNTALPEEILFRGFILKIFSRKSGFQAANYIQCILFGFLHGAMFLSRVGVVKGTLITCFTMAIAWFMGYINEKKADGSILPSWAIHAVANIFSGVIAAFSLI